MNFGEYIKRPMIADASKPKIVLYNSPIPVIRAVADPLASEFQFVFAGDSDSLSSIAATNADAAIFLLCESDSSQDTSEILERMKTLLPNCSRALITDGTNLVEAKNLLTKDLANQVLPATLDSESASLRFTELVQVHKLKWQVSEIEKIAITDPTTGLPNSRFFQSSMEVLIDKSLSEKTPFSLILADVDQFRNFNETFGYGEGDKILAAIGDRIRSLIPDCLNIFRLGSDEFGILVKASTTTQAHQFAESLRRGFEQIPFAGPNRRSAYVTVSVGVALFPDHGVQYGDIMTTAKGALNQAKRRGRNQTVVSQVC